MPYKQVSRGEAAGTSLRGTVKTSYQRLVDLFGEPNSKGDGYKVHFEWILKDDEGNFVTIYVYKWDKPEMAKTIPTVEWHIGAKSEAIAEKLEQFILYSR